MKDIESIRKMRPLEPAESCEAGFGTVAVDVAVSGLATAACPADRTEDGFLGGNQ